MSALGWAYYVLGVSLLVVLGAAALEATLRAAGRSGRWAWVLALAVLLAVPLSAWLRPAPPTPAPVVDVLALPLVLLPPLTAAAESRSFDPAGLLPYAWLAASVLLLLVLLLSWASLRRAARGWRPDELEGVRCWLSARTGPAVVGIRRPRIVLPEWVLELASPDRRFTVLHEHEHLRAGDARLLLFGLGCAVLLPWNPVVWWALHRLRGAIELDCDGRVLARAGDPAGYGRLLLEVGRRRTDRYLLAAAFAEPRVLLERRVRALLRWPEGRRPLTALLTGAAALLCFGFAWVTPNPLARGAQQPAVPVSAAPALPLLLPADTPPPLGRAPTFTPFTLAPELQNRDEITKALIAEYPPVLKAAGIGGKILTWVFINDGGVVDNALVKQTSGYAEFDSAAIAVARLMRFRPAMNRDARVPVWVEIPIVFTVGDAGNAPGITPPGIAPPGGAPPGGAPPNVRPPQVPRDQLERAPSFTPFTLAPELTNRDEVTKALAAEYPPALKAAGVGGKVGTWIFIDETGTVTRAQVKTSSGYAALDSAALKVAGAMRFRPALNRDRKVPVWVEIPIVFTLDGAKPQPSAEEKARAEMARQLSSYEVSGGEGRINYSGAFREGPGKVGFGPGQRQIANPEEVLAALAKTYPPTLRQAGIGGTVQLRLWAADDGTPSNPQVTQSSGRKELDAAALGVAKTMRFKPGTAGWVVVPLEFGAQERDLTNRDDITRALVRNYPPALRDAGIGGKVELYLYIDEEGRVQKAQVTKTSGHDELDRAALTVANLMRFAKASHAGWITVPLAFALQ